MNVILTKTTIAQDITELGFEKNNGVDIFTATVDTDTNWEYKLDVKYSKKSPEGEYLYNIIDLSRNDNVCSALLTSAMLPFSGKYLLQLRGINGEKVYHTDVFEAWVKYSIEPGATYDPVPSEFYQIEQNISELNSHPPVPGDNGYWLIWNLTTKQYEESTFPLPSFDLSNYYTKEQTDSAIEAGVKVVTDGLADGTIIPAKATSATNDGDGNSISGTYATKTSVDGVNTNIDNIVNGTTVVGKASKDAKGNVIDTTYATKTELNNKTKTIRKTINTSITGATIIFSEDELSILAEYPEKVAVEVASLSTFEAQEFRLSFVSIGSPAVYVFETISENYSNTFGYYFSWTVGQSNITISQKEKLATKSSVDTLTTKVNQNTTDIGNKLDKVTSTSALERVYTINADGSQGTEQYSINPQSTTIVKRNNRGEVLVAAVISNNAATSKQYVDNTIASQVSSVYKAKGSIATISDLPAASKDTEGFVYNIESEFTTTADFVEGEGKTYPAGTNVVIVNTTGTEYKYDVLSGMVDLSGYATTDALNTGLSGKLDKVTTEGTTRVYAIAANGTQTTVPYSDNNYNSFTLVQRTDGGQITINTPQAAGHAATKGYVDNLVGNINTILATMFNDVSTQSDEEQSDEETIMEVAE